MKCHVLNYCIRYFILGLSGSQARFSRRIIGVFKEAQVDLKQTKIRFSWAQVDPIIINVLSESQNSWFVAPGGRRL